MVGGGALAGLCTAIAVSTGAPAAIWFIARRRVSIPPIDVALGAATFLLMVVILEAALHNYVLRANPERTAWFAAHPAFYVFYGLAAAALFEEVGRVIALAFIARRARSGRVRGSRTASVMVEWRAC